MGFLQKELWGNTIESWIIGVSLALILVIAFRLFKGLVSHKLKRRAELSRTIIDDLFVHLAERTGIWFFVVVAVYIGSLVLVLPAHTRDILKTITAVVIIIQFGVWGSALIYALIQLKLKKRADEGDSSAKAMIIVLNSLGKFILWSLILLLILDNLGIKITTLVAGLGIGGIAVALAVQNVLGDLLASISIILDKPFEIDDFITVDNYAGTVEHIGIKTTRVRSLTGEQIVFPNNDLLKSRVRNYKRMKERRVAFQLGVVYQTPVEKLKKIPGMIKEIIDSVDMVRFGRAHFKSFGDFALIYEVVYYVLDRDYDLYMDAQQEINLKIAERFENEGIEFAYPTQTIFLEKS